MPDHRDIYAHHADEYDQLINYEDHSQNILPAIEKVCQLDGLDIVESGAGTGRITRLITPIARTVRFFDVSSRMLQVARTWLKKNQLTNWQCAVADHRNLPVLSHSADLIISGWSVCYIYNWNENCWEEELNRTFFEFQRVLRPGGRIILLETLGTGFEAPQRLQILEPYYRYLETHGFSFFWIRTDYQFPTWQIGESICRFFFGDELGSQIVQQKSTLLPECTGIWFRGY